MLGTRCVGLSIALRIFIFLSGFVVVTTLNLKFQQTDYKIKFERVELVNFNKKYVKSYKIITYKYNRTCPLVNFTYEYKIDLGYDLEIISQAYVFLSNEYRVFPLRLEVNWCEAVTKNYAGMGNVKKCGNVTGCPQTREIIYHHCNWAPQESEFPPFIPNGKYMLESQGVFHDTELWLTRAYATVDRPIPIVG